VEHKTLVVGLGNPILGDDGAGWAVVEAVERLLEKQAKEQPGLDFICLSVGGLSLMEHLIGYDRAIIIDAINLQQDPAGTVYCFPLEELPSHAAGHMTSSHDTTLQNALEMGRTMGAHLPESIAVIGIESPNVYDFSDQLTPPIAVAIPEAARLVWEVLFGRGCT
jgi:hydrogenase maturation protease